MGLPASAPVLSLLDNGILLFAGLSGHGVYMSPDLGNTWMARNNGMLAGLNVSSMVMNDSVIFAGTNYGVYRSPDNGEHWFQVNSGLSSLSVNKLVNAADGILAGTSNGLFFTSDHGDQWNNVSDGLIDKEIHSVAVSGELVYVGSGYFGVWQNFLYVITGIVENKTTDRFSCYPVPLQNRLTIRSKIPGTSLQNIMIYNMKGECVQQITPTVLIIL